MASIIGRYRWVICGVLFLAATTNYVDRQVLGVLKPVLATELHWDDVTYGNIVTAFQVAYAIGMLSMGRLLDKVGTRAGFALAAGLWGVAAAAHALATTALGFGVARFALGLGEAGMFPAGVKAVAQWFPKKERAFAMGLFNSGTNVGAIVCPLIVPWMVTTAGSRTAFLVTGGLALAWVGLWLSTYAPPNEHPRMTAGELAHIQSDPVKTFPPIRWRTLLLRRQTWAFAIGKFLTDPIWWLYLFWVPDFLHRRHGLNITQIGLPLVVIYLMSDVGSVAGGWLSSRLIRAGSSVNTARKVSMAICGLSVVPLVFAANADSVWTGAVLIGFATAGHQGFSANLFTLPSDLFPEKAVGSVVGIGGMAGAIGGIFVAQLAGQVLEATGSYYVLFLTAPTAYLIALLVIQVLSPRLEPVALAELPAPLPAPVPSRWETS
ncbi:MAG TPA: MFS transporter [Polyangiaceae bacterium]|jgi:ACS family hexuronate transporter-like MFS transporter